MFPFYHKKIQVTKRISKKKKKNLPIILNRNQFTNIVVI